jgi:ankyrin repeat protein
MSDALRLADRPNLDHYKKLAKEVQRACRSRRPDAIRDWAAAWLARQRDVDPGDVDRVMRQWQQLLEHRPTFAGCALTAAQFFLARVHGFASWPAFAAHLEGLARVSSGTALFESAVDAVVSGDAAALQRILRERPSLVHERSTRDHRATLLHYVSANGVEDFRQKTPKNIVDIARLLLDAGAAVNAEANSYSGHDTTFLLTATSAHPDAANLQIPLLELLLERGAILDHPGSGSDVNACLHNGREKAAVFCADHGGRLDLEGAAGVGRLDVVRTFLQPDGTLTRGATRQQLIDGFAWACEYGRAPVVAYMIDAGVPLDGRLRHDGQTALHWAAYGGHTATVRLLVSRNASVSIRDLSYDGTPLDWAIYAWGNRTMAGDERDAYYDVVSALVRAGGAFNPEWLSEDDRERARVARRLKADARMIAALKGEA